MGICKFLPCPQGVHDILLDPRPLGNSAITYILGIRVDIGLFNDKGVGYSHRSTQPASRASLIMPFMWFLGAPYHLPDKYSELRVIVCIFRKFGHGLLKFAEKLKKSFFCKTKNFLVNGH